MKKKVQSPLNSLRDHLQLSYSSNEVKEIFDGFSLQRTTTLRINTLKITKEDFLAEALKYQVILEPVDWYENAFILRSPTQREFSELPLYTESKCYIQSLSSMLPPLVLNPQPHEKVLDLCAAPGSKTSQIAMMMNNTGEIVANDASHTRIYRLKANLENLGVTNTKVVRSVGQGLWHEYPEYFDKALVDVPCSMEGRIQLETPTSYEDWSVKKVKELQEVQKFLLRSAISATRPGGTIVYSTCTLSLEENEKVIQWILRKEAGKVELENFDIQHVPWKQAFDNQSTKKIFPSQTFEGFFIAKLRKLQTTVSY